MLFSNSTKLKLPLYICILSALLAPAISQANTEIAMAVTETGTIAATKAADQKAALAKKAADRKKAAEAQKAAEAAKLTTEHKIPELNESAK